MFKYVMCWLRTLWAYKESLYLGHIVLFLRNLHMDLHSSWASLYSHWQCRKNLHPSSFILCRLPVIRYWFSWLCTAFLTWEHGISIQFLKRCFFTFMCMEVSARMCVHYVDTVSMKAGRRHHVPWTCEPPCGYRESNLDLLKEQPLLLTTKPFLQPP